MRITEEAHQCRITIGVRFVEQARRDLTALLAAYPDLEQDDVLRLDMIEGETNALELIDLLIAAEREALSLEEAVRILQERLAIRQARFANRRGALRKYLMQLMEAAGLKKVERPAATVSIAAGRQKVVITNEDDLPTYCVRITREPDKTIIKDLLSGGHEINGAILSNAEPVLRIS
jgi:hypothetical protein